MSELSKLMSAFRTGDKRAASDLVELFYPELRRLAALKMRGERAAHTWQPTTLVNELYLELLKVKQLDQSYGNQDERAAFLGLASHVMRRLLIHHSRPLEKKVERVELHDTSAQSPATDAFEEIDQLLGRLASIHARLRVVVEMRIFEGCTVNEIARRLDCSEATVARSWAFAKVWLRENLNGK